MTDDFVLLAGATGDLGGRIARSLLARGVELHALVRDRAPADAVDRLEGLGATVVRVDPGARDAVTAACTGAGCVVSAMSGLREVILDVQTVLLDAAVRAGVPRFISSDYSADYTKTEPGHNRNFDLRREFAGRADRAPIRTTSVLNGAFMDMLGAEMPIIQPRLRRVLYWGSPDQPLDFTTRDDTAAYTAAVAVDDTAPRILRVAGDTVSARNLADAMSEASGQHYRTLWAGSLGILRAMIPAVKRLAGNRPDPVFPAWQGMAYSLDMYSGDARLNPLDNDRYPDLTWTTVRDRFTHGHLPGATTSAGS